MRLAKTVGNQIWYDKYHEPVCVKSGEEIPDWILKRYVVSEDLLQSFSSPLDLVRLIETEKEDKAVNVIAPVPLVKEIEVAGGGCGEYATGLTPTGGGGLVTGITVCCDTRVLLERSLNSIRQFYPDMPIIIINCSSPGNSCDPYARSLVSDLTTVISPGSNIGHGPGMNLGIDYSQTRYALMFDTDAELLEPCVGEMLAMMEEDTFGVGYVIPTAFSGFGTWYPNPPPKEKVWMPYLHPYFHLLDIKNYRKFPPYINSGAPCTPTMLAIYNQGLSDRILKQFKDQANDDVRTPRIVKHNGGGTCHRDPKLCT